MSHTRGHVDDVNDETAALSICGRDAGITVVQQNKVREKLVCIHGHVAAPVGAVRCRLQCLSE